MRAVAIEQRVRRVEWIELGVVLAAGLLVHLAFIESSGYRDDMTIFYQWLKSAALTPASQMYAKNPDINYPAAYVVVLECSAAVMRWFVHGTPSEYVMNIALKLPAIIFDLVGAALGFIITRRHATNALALVAAAFVALNPALIYDSAYWGQNESVPTVIAVFAMYALAAGNPIAAWTALAFAILFKPPVLVLVPLLLLYPVVVPVAQRRRRLVQTLMGIAAALALTQILAVVFFSSREPLTALRHLVAQVVSGSSLFPYNSLNAFNFWAIFQPFFVADGEHVLGLSLHKWSIVMFCGAAAAIAARYVVRREASALYEPSALLLLAFFVFMTEMHERYLVYAVVFVGLLLFKRPYRWAALILTLTLVLNLEYGRTFMFLDDAHAAMIDRFEYAPWLIHLCSFANLGVFVWLFADYLGVGARPASWLRRLRTVLFEGPVIGPAS